MNIPIKKELYEKYRNQLYEVNEEIKLLLNIDINDDISNNIKKIVDYKTKIIAMLNHALHNKIYWKKIINKIELHREKIINKVKLEETEQKMNVDTKKAYAELKADEILSQTLFNGESYTNKMANIQDNYYDAEIFYSEVKNIYDYLSEIVMIIGILNKLPNKETSTININDFVIGGDNVG